MLIDITLILYNVYAYIANAYIKNIYINYKIHFTHLI